MQNWHRRAGSDQRPRPSSCALRLPIGAGANRRCRNPRHGGRARSDGAVGPGCGARTNVAQPPLLDDERHRCGYRTSAPRSVSAVRVRRKGDLAVPAVTQRRCLAEGTGARLRFSRSFFFLLRSFRQRLTDLEPRPIDSDPSRLELQHGPRPRRGRPVRNRRSGSSLRPSLSPRPGIALDSEFACCPGRRAHWPGRNRCPGNG